MAFFYQEPAFSSQQSAEKTAILLLNLGTPDSTSTQDVKRYLAEFLADGRVIEAPSWLWKIILHGIILPFRSKKSAHAYEKIWSKEGSPLLNFTRKQAEQLQKKLQNQGSKVVVDYAMTYGNPSVKQQLAQLKALGVTRLLIVPLYPQYAASSTGAALDQVYRELLKQRNMQSIRTVKDYHDHPAYLDALATGIETHWQQHGRAKKLLMSFHGIPKISVEKGDPYYQHCQTTAAALANRLDLTEEQYTLCFQSRFGPAKWLGPSTQDLLVELPQSGIDSLDIVCPGFSSDCLETMEEICLQGKADFHAAGGKTFQYIPCLNAQNMWIDALATICQENLQGWPQ